jgi:hypothetical protein
LYHCFVQNNGCRGNEQRSRDKINMRFFFLIIMAAVLLLSESGVAQTSQSSAANDALSLSVLRTIEYADLTRIVTLQMCKRRPELVEQLPACSKIGAVPNTAIEKMVLPYFKRYVSPADAKAALAFWSSADGAKISKKMLREIADNNPTLLTSDEKQLLNNFNQSDAGLALSRLARDRDVSKAMIRAIGAYAP